MFNIFNFSKKNVNEFTTTVLFDDNPFVHPNSLEEGNNYIINTIKSIIDENNLKDSSLQSLMFSVFKLTRNVNLLIEDNFFNDYSKEEKDYLFLGYSSLTTSIITVSNYLINDYNVCESIFAYEKKISDETIMKSQLKFGLSMFYDYVMHSYNYYKDRINEGNGNIC